MSLPCQQPISPTVTTKDARGVRQSFGHCTLLYVDTVLFYVTWESWIFHEDGKSKHVQFS